MGRSLPFLVLMAAIIPVHLLADRHHDWHPRRGSADDRRRRPVLWPSGGERAARVAGGGHRGGGRLRRVALAIIASAQLSEAMPALAAAVTLNLVSMIEYSAIAGTIGAGGIGYLAVVYGYQRFDNHIMIATIAALIATIQLIQILGDRLVNRLRHTQGNLV